MNKPEPFLVVSWYLRKAFYKGAPKDDFLRRYKIHQSQRILTWFSYYFIFPEKSNLRCLIHSFIDCDAFIPFFVTIFETENSRVPVLGPFLRTE